jgi:tRNA nucleotidyltransferase (CCA-adding enzyme)
LQCALLDRIDEQPGGEALLGAAYEGVYLVGGAVRDLLRAERPRELDVLVEGPIEPLLHALGGEVVAHDRFETASISLGDARIDVARARRERYPEPGALPEVEPASLVEDLLRRDFTVNAIAVTLDAAREREVHASPGALEDLRAGRLRVLHDSSFIDDPTRLLRLARYAARLEFEVEPHTAELASRAVASRALDTVSGARIGAELRLALGEADAVAALAAMDDLGLLRALHPRLRFEARLARAALDLLSTADAGKEKDTCPDLLLLAVLLKPMVVGIEVDVETEMSTILNDLEFSAADRNLVLQAAICVDAVVEELGGAEIPSEIHDAASHVPLEGIALAGAWAELQGYAFREATHAAREWLAELHKVSLLITGDDLLAAGIPEGPEIGRRLDVALRWKLDEELVSAANGEPPTSDREAELTAALRARV